MHVMYRSFFGTSPFEAGMAYSAVAVSVFEEWKANESLCHNAAKACLTQIGKKENLNRAEVSHNHKVLAPVIHHIGYLIYLIQFFIFPYFRIYGILHFSKSISFS